MRFVNDSLCFRKMRTHEDVPWLKANTANLITGVRVVCSLALICTVALSPSFYALYLVAGLTDMIDGWVARRTGTTSEWGAKWDTIADLIFVAVSLFKLIPVIVLPFWMYLWIDVIACIKFFNMGYGYVVHKRLVAIHSHLNKATGCLLFLLPLTMNIIDLNYSAAVVCLVASFAAIHEGVKIVKNRHE